MLTYPFRTPLCPYRSKRDRHKCIQWVACSKELENFINREFQASSDKIVQFGYGQVALSTNIPIEVVRDMLTLAGGGYNGIMIATGK